MDRKQLKQKISSLPQESGCYLFYNKNQHVIYVGKAKKLKARVQSYFNESIKSPKTEILVSRIQDFQFILTDSESEALILENNLIKKYNPKYNIQFRDDKSYPYIFCQLDEPFPRLVYTRRPNKKGSYRIFGPFVTGSNIRHVMMLLIKLFRLRDCNLREFNQRKEPCLLYQMHQCSAPCVEKIDAKEYKRDLMNALSFLDGKVEETLQYLEKTMMDYAEKEEFEKAKIIRDSLYDLEKFSRYHQENNVELANTENVDIISWYEEDQEIDLIIYMIRGGMLLGSRHFCFIHYHENDYFEEIMSGIIKYYCNNEDKFPDKIIIDEFHKQNIKNFSKLLSSTLNKNKQEIEVLSPTAESEKLIALTKQQALSEREVRLNNINSFNQASGKLASLLGLESPPRRMECYDVAIWQGSSPTASQVVFFDGLPVKKDYRHYHLEAVDEGNNDFAMMKEVISRRLAKKNLPDVLVVDGGIGQVNTVKKVLEDFDLDIPLAGIAKSRVKGDAEKTEERLFIYGRRNPYILKNCLPLFRLLVQMRDEAHRFSRRLHHNSEKKKLIKSWVDKIKGIGRESKDHIKKNLSRTEKEYKDLSVSELEEELNIERDIAESYTTIYIAVSFPSFLI